MRHILKEIGEVIKYRELLRNLVIRDIKVRYKRSVLGFLWVMLNPLLMMLILNIVFSEIFKVSTKNYTVYLLSGIILWNFFSQSTSTALNSLVGNGNLIKKLYLPKYIFPLSVVISAVVNLIFSILPLFAIFLITDTFFSRYIYLLPLIIVAIAVFSFGVSLMLSTLAVFFHDMKYVYEIILLAWMYMTPIFYPEAIVPRKYDLIFALNPLNYYLNLFRATLYSDSPLLPEKLLYAILFSLLALIIGWFFYGRFKNRVVYYL